MTEAEQIMKRCQIGTRNYNEANNLHAECYRVIGKLLKAITELESKEPVAKNICIECANADSWGLPDKSICQLCFANSKWQPLNASSKNPYPPQRTEQSKACVYCGQLVAKEKNNA